MSWKDSLLSRLSVSWQAAFDRQCLPNLLLHCFLILPTLTRAVGPILRGNLVLFRVLFVCKPYSSSLQGYLWKCLVRELALQSQGKRFV